MILVIASSCLLGGCSTISGWFGGGSSGPPPAPLVELHTHVQLKTIWTTSLGDGAGGQYVQLVPAVDGSRLYAAARDGRVAAFDTKTGKRLWDADTKAHISGGIGLGDGMVLVGTNEAGIIALDEKTGKRLWQATVSSEVLSAPQAKSGVVVAQTVDGTVVGLSAKDGHELWVYDRSVPVLSLRGTATPTFFEGAVLVGFASGKMVALNLKNGELIWATTVAEPTGRSELARMVDIDSAPKVVGSVVYAVTYQGRVAAFNVANGNPIWARKMSSYAGLSVDGGAVYVTDADSDVWALDRTSGASIWKQDKLHNRALTAPTAFGSYLAVGDFEGYLHLLSKSDGSLQARIRVGKSGILAAPVVVGDTLYVYGEGGTLSACRVTGG
ncbi:MAG: outer membrane protein assembly factor BamB [Gammaproteobacteria bacterium]